MLNSKVITIVNWYFSFPYDFLNILDFLWLTLAVCQSIYVPCSVNTLTIKLTRAVYIINCSRKSVHMICFLLGANVRDFWVSDPSSCCRRCCHYVKSGNCQYFCFMQYSSVSLFFFLYPFLTILTISGCLMLFSQYMAKMSINVLYP